MDHQLENRLNSIQGSIRDVESSIGTVKFFVFVLMVAFGYYTNPKEYQHRAAIFNEYPLAQFAPSELDKTADFSSFIIFSKIESVYEHYNIITEKTMDNDLTFAYLGTINVNRKAINRLFLESDFSVSDNLRNRHPKFVSLLFDFKEQNSSNNEIQKYFDQYANADSTEIEGVYRDWRADLIQRISAQTESSK